MNTAGWDRRQFRFWLATRCGVSRPESDLDFVRLVDACTRGDFTLEEAHGQWLATIAKRTEKPAPGTLGDWTAAWKDCTRCPLHRNRKEAALGWGPVPADLLVITNGTGEQDDLLARAFRIFDDCDLSYFVTGIVACPSESRPTVSQAARCHGRLAATIRDVRPLSLVLMGHQPLRHLFDLDSVRDHRGQVMWWPDMMLSAIPTWHSDDIGDPRRMGELRADFRKAAERALQMREIPF